MRLLDGLLLLLVTIDVALVAAAVVSLSILWSILITAGLCDMGLGGGSSGPRSWTSPGWPQ